MVGFGPVCGSWQNKARKALNQSRLWGMHQPQPCACSSCLVFHGIVFWHTCRDGDQCQAASCHSYQPALWRCFHSALWASLAGLVHTSQARKSKAVSEYIQPCRAKLDTMGALEAISFAGEEERLSTQLDLPWLTSWQNATFGFYLGVSQEGSRWDNPHLSQVLLGSLCSWTYWKENTFTNG